MYIQKRFNSDDNIQHLQITDNLKIILWQRLCLMQIHLIKHNFHIMTCLWDTVGFGEDQHSFAWGALQVVTFADMASSCSSLSLTIAVITSHHITSPSTPKITFGLRKPLSSASPYKNWFLTSLVFDRPDLRSLPPLHWKVVQLGSKSLSKESRCFWIFFSRFATLKH